MNKLEYYHNLLNKENMPEFIKSYLNSSSMNRLSKIGYFCGMDYASKDIYNFNEYVSRLDHSLSVSLLIWNLTHDMKSTIAGLFHDISTPVFSHVIDYMNKDYSNQESTEEFTHQILKRDEVILENLKKDKIELEEISNFKNFSLVDNKRPKLCADRLDGVILTGLFWTKSLDNDGVKSILESLEIYEVDGEKEIGFNNLEVASLVMKVNDEIDSYCHSNEDNYMMELLSFITKLLIKKRYIKYEDLFKLNEEEMFSIINNCSEDNIKYLYDLFKNIKRQDVPLTIIDDVKKRELNVLVKGKRIN